VIARSSNFDLTDRDPAHRARKRFGQHFLTDRAIIDAIAQSIVGTPGQRIIEIGPGQAALTEALLASGQPVCAVEIDRDLAARLRKRFGDRLDLIEADALTVDFAALARQGPSCIVGNLPYNISSPLLIHLLSARESVQHMVFMLQKEVVDRIVAPSASAQFGRLSVMMQAVWNVESLFDVPPQAFDPPPAVDSAVIRLRSGQRNVGDATLHALEELVQVAFSQRRKMLRNTLLPWLEERAVEWNDLPTLSPTTRPQDVGVDDYVKCAERLVKQQSTAP
jgi:16S rRNA (adenine1518-N6/adenine1519-N6)-dimethyltransferase